MARGTGPWANTYEEVPTQMSSVIPTTVRRGVRVETSGQGRTARWPHSVGTVTAVRGGRVFVQWDGTHFEDEMEAVEVQVAASQRACRGLCGCDGSLVCQCMCHEQFPEPVYSQGWVLS